jgi:CrcB protein
VPDRVFLPRHVEVAARGCGGFGARCTVALVAGHEAQRSAAGRTARTLLANLLGAFIIGAALAWLAGNATISPEWRLLITTGFCGGLTTFSTFSAEVFTLLQQGRPGWAALATAMHVGGSLLMTLAGYAAWQWLRLR